MNVTVGHVEVPVSHLDRFAEMEPVVAHDLMALIEQGVDLIMNSTLNIKAEWTSYVGTLGDASQLDWVFIDNLLATLSVRWHPQSELTRSGDGNWRVRWWNSQPWARPRNLGRGVRVQKEEGADEFFFREAVTALDNIFLPRAMADSAPVVELGSWPNASEIVTGLKLCTILDSSVQGDSGRRARAGGLDRIDRSKFLRRALEEMKFGLLIRDEVVAPGGFPQLNHRWQALAYGKLDNSGLIEVAKMALGGDKQMVTWSWRGNQLQARRQTYTGIRSSTSQWGRESSGSLGIGLEGTSLQYVTGVLDWLNQHYSSEESPKADVKAYRICDRLNLVEVGGLVTSRNWPQRAQRSELAVRLGTGTFSELWKGHGWNEPLPAPIGTYERFPSWTFGLRQKVMDFNIGELLTLALGGEGEGLLRGRVQNPGIRLTFPPQTTFAEGTGS